MSKTVLVADDNAVSRELVREILEAADYSVTEAADGREALARIEQAPPDVVVLDLQMPEPDGFAVLHQLRAGARFRSLPVLALTAYAMPSDRERALAAGFDGYVTKPVNAAVLRRELERVAVSAR